VSKGKEEEVAVSPLAAALAALEYRRPDHIGAADWQHAVEDGRRFLIQWGEQATALGWGEPDVFGLPPVPSNPHPSWRRLAPVDQLGLVWLTHGKPVTSITAERATIATADGGAVAFYRPRTAPNLGPGAPLDERGVPRAASVPFMLTQDMRRHEILAHGDDSQLPERPRPTGPNELGLSPYTIRELARWYEEEGNRRRLGPGLDQNALDRDLRGLLAECGVPPEFVAIEFERVMQVVFGPPDAPWPVQRKE
jgi:hypothetical protein